MSNYTVQSGDSLFAIAKEFYGDGNRWREIYEANQNILTRGPNRISIGAELVIPGLEAKPEQDTANIGGSEEIKKQADGPNITAIAQLIAQNIDTPFQRGVDNPNVRELQQLLTNQGFDPKGVDGKLGRNTQAAIDAFIKANPEAIAKAQDDIRIAKEQARLLAMESVDIALNEGIADKSQEELEAFEQKLNALGFNPGKVDGVIDQAAFKAIGSFATEHNQDYLETQRTAIKSHIVSGPLNNEAIAAIQPSLSILGYPTGSHDGKDTNRTTLRSIGQFMAKEAPDQLANLAQQTNEMDKDKLTETQVRTIQQTATMLGIPAGPIDGKRGSRTKGAETYLDMMLNESAPKLNRSQLRTLQEALRISGHYKDSIDGLYGPNTEKAISGFIADNPVVGALGIDGSRLDTRLSAAVLSQTQFSAGQTTRNNSKPASASLDANGILIGGNNVDMYADPASTTKMATLLTLADMHRNGEIPKDFFETHAKYINGMMQSSDNRYAVKLGHLAMGSEYRVPLFGKRRNLKSDNPEFIERMNQMAQERGLIRTQFVNSHGYPARGHHSSAYDMARFTFMLNDEYKSIADTYASVEDSRTGGARFADSYGVDIGKTGTGSSKYGSNRSGRARSFVGAHDDGRAFAVTEANSGSLSEAIRKASGMRRPGNDQHSAVNTPDATEQTAKADLGNLPSQQIAVIEEQKQQAASIA